ncbi:hypothetical protein, partial [Prevotellamassilia timonensis]|uniref:hypothetical protein n=1 Tax=Prevotellamassilia timonensis TaxID=1852370 RepID=UPI001F303AE0
MNNIRSPATATPPRNQRISIMFDFLMIELILTYIVFPTVIEDKTYSNGNTSQNFSSKDFLFTLFAILLLCKLLNKVRKFFS